MGSFSTNRLVLVAGSSGLGSFSANHLVLVDRSSGLEGSFPTSAAVLLMLEQMETDWASDG